MHIPWQISRGQLHVYTECHKMNSKFVLNLPKYIANLYLMQYIFAVFFGTLSTI